MNFTTVYETFDPNEIPELEKLFGKEKFEYRIIKGANNDTKAEGWKLQVPEDQKEKATYLLLNHNFKRKPVMTRAEKPKSRFWIFLIVAVILIILAGILVNGLMN